MNAALAMILDAAARAPDAPAIERTDGSRVTCAELVAAANRHARELHHAPPVVEVVADRSDDFIARCLGAWIAGRAWLPVDPSDPRSRPPVEQRGLAYVIATSGTTGAPKLVMLGPGGLSALLHAQIDAFALASGARALWLHSPLFDASLSDWATALASGATLVIPTVRALASGDALRDELATRAITHVDLPPALLPFLDPLPRALRVVIVGGEPCPVARVRSLARAARVVVVYGPTEATVCSSLVVVDPDTWERPLIGQPLPGVRYHVSDSGELYIAGDALAVGYAGDPAETEARFVDVDGVRMYRTGDRVEPTPHGLAFMGRVDRERKVRGRRVDLDAIEATLRALFADEVAVVVRDERIVAFSTVPLDGTRIAAALPAHMRPARTVVFAEGLPRTPTGKLDRAALEAHTLPIDVCDITDPHERHLALAWCQVLGIERVCRADRWLACGGDSLARVMFHAATGVTIEGDPTFGDVVGEAVAHAIDREDAMAVTECEARGRALLAQVDREGRARATSAATSAPRGAILVTGATGFLGRALVRALARSAPDRPLVALVRGRSTTRDGGTDRDRNIGRELGHDLGVEVVRGDVARPYLGLDRDAWDALRARVGVLVHCAATIQLGGTWDEHVAVNVRGTAECARFAGDDVAWHHVSTLSVFVNTDHARGRHVAGDVPRGVAYGGYAQTKIAAEAIARDCGATVYRLGLLVGDGDRGQLPMTMRALRKLGCAPADARDERFDATPVEYAAAVVADGVVRGVGGVQHVASRRGVTCGELVAQLGIAEVERELWVARARERVADPDVAMAIVAFSARRDRTLFLATGADLGAAEDAP